MFNSILEYAQMNECSDIHIVTNERPIVRELGQIKRLEMETLNRDQVYEWIYQILNDEQKEMFNSGKDVDMSYTDNKGNRYRVNVFRQRETPAMVLRLLNSKIPTVDEMGLPPILKELAAEPRGLVLVTGPTGSGKSTTLAAMINEINLSQNKHILTLEDPVEYLHNPKKSLINQREIHTDSHSFSDALRSALREDPDVILVGEMRDFETMQLALTAAETGHLVFSTLHTTGAPATIDRIIDTFPPHQQSQIRSQLASVLVGVVSQVLIPRIDQRGRIAAHEIMIMTDAIGNLIREGKIFQISSSMQTGQNKGMYLLESSLAQLANRRVISKESALELANNPSLINRLIGM